FAGELRILGPSVIETVGVALGTGLLAAALALVGAWAAQQGRWQRRVVLGLAALAWALPAPVVGIGLKTTIMALMQWAPIEPLPFLLSDGPSPVPIVWAHLLRFTPYALAILWPAVRLVPSELRDAARLEGAGPLGELWHVTAPMTRKAFGVAV